MLTLAQAESYVRAYWQLPAGSETLEAARLACLMDRIVRGLPYDQWEPLRFRLTGKRAPTRTAGMVIQYLTQAVDRRKRRNPPLAGPAVAS